MKPKKIPIDEIEDCLELYSNEELSELEAMSGSLLEDRMRAGDEAYDREKEAVLREEHEKKDLTKLPEDEKRRMGG